MLTADSFFNLTDFQHAPLFKEGQYVWSALADLKEYMHSLNFPEIDRKSIPDGSPLPKPVVFHDNCWISSENLKIEYGDATKGKIKVTLEGNELPGASVIMAGSVLMGDKISIGKGVLIESGATIKSPTVIGDNCEVRQGAYLRGYCLTGKRCVLGHTTEIKHSILLNDAKAGHFAYLGDSILGTNVNLGAGTKFANLKMVPGNVFFKYEGKLLDSGRRKFGAILGDNCQTGCNSVTNPGTVFGPKCLLMPNTTAPSGYHPPRKLIR